MGLLARHFSLAPEALVEFTVGVDKGAFGAFRFSSRHIIAPVSSQMGPVTVSHPALSMPHVVLPHSIILAAIAILHGTLSMAFPVSQVAGVLAFREVCGALSDLNTEVPESLMRLPIRRDKSPGFVAVTVQEATFVYGPILFDQFSLS